VSAANAPRAPRTPRPSACSSPLHPFAQCLWIWLHYHSNLISLLFLVWIKKKHHPNLHVKKTKNKMKKQNEKKTNWILFFSIIML
jgi:hypothetical protein